MSEKVFLVTFDAKVKTYVQRREYAAFVKQLKSFGYLMVQQSVYAKYSDRCGAEESEKRKILAITPATVEVRVFVLSYAQFAQSWTLNCNAINFAAKERIICV